MKHIINSSIALLVIVLMAAFTAPSVPDKPDIKKTEVSLKQGLPGAQSHFLVVNNLFSQGNLPEPVEAPAPRFVKYVVDKVVKDEKDRKRENRALKQKPDIVTKI